MIKKEHKETKESYLKNGWKSDFSYFNANPSFAAKLP